MMRRLLVWLVVLAVLAGVGWWFWPFFLPAAKQVERQQILILNKAGHHGWQKVASLVADDYHDAAGMNKSMALDTAKGMLDSFLTVNFEWTTTSVEVKGKEATLIGTLRMKATGPIGGSMVTDRVNEVREPWKFVWRKDGWNPDDWRLISVTNSEVENISP